MRRFSPMWQAFTLLQTARNWAAGSYSGTVCPRESLHARVAPLPLFGSMLS